MSLIVVKMRRKWTLKQAVIEARVAAKRKTVGRKVVKLILVDSLNLLVGRVSVFAYFVASSVDGDIDDRFPVAGLVSLVTTVSLIVKFFIFYKLNNHFRAEIDGMVGRVRGWLGLDGCVLATSQGLAKMRGKSSTRTTT